MEDEFQRAQALTAEECVAVVADNDPRVQPKAGQFRRRAFAQRAPYLFHAASDGRVWDQGTRSFQCSRRADALKLIVETFLEGDDHRLLVVNGELVAATRRTPRRPHRRCRRSTPRDAKPWLTGPPLQFSNVVARS